MYNFYRLNQPEIKRHTFTVWQRNKALLFYLRLIFELCPNTCTCFCTIETDPDQKWACLNIFALQSLTLTVNHQQHCKKEPFSKTSYTVTVTNYQILNYQFSLKCKRAVHKFFDLKHFLLALVKSSLWSRYIDVFKILKLTRYCNSNVSSSLKVKTPWRFLMFGELIQGQDYFFM